MPRYKRTAEAAQLDVAPEPAIAPEAQETLTTLRNMWEFASLMQYIFLFGHVVKIDDSLDIEDLEHECLQPTPSEKLAHIGLQLLKYVSSHRGLTPEIFDEYTRRQYLAKAPQRNPFGDEEEPIRFNDLDIYTRVKVLQQLSVWTLGNAERIRGMMPQDEDHLGWRIEPLGWDKEDRSYYVLDDDRLYRRTDEPLPPPTPKPKAKPKAKKSSKSKAKPPTRGTRTSKRRKVEESEDEEVDDEHEADDTVMDDTLMTNGDETLRDDVEDTGYGFTRKTWELVAITLEEYQDFMASIFRSRDPNEKQLRARIETDVLPIIEKRAEALRAKQMKKLRELENLSKMATAKRSSRLADKADKEAEAQKEREAQEQRQRELKMAREEQERQKRIEEGHESRRLTREQRVREREAKRIIHEEELARLEAEGDRAVSQDVELEDADGEVKRASGRQRQTQREQHKKELEKLAEEDGSWYFDCVVCGQYGENMDDGSHSIACDRCNVWQHSKCHGYTPKQAEQETFVFICGTCKRKEEDAKKPKIPPLKLHNRSSDSPENHKAGSRPSTANGQHPHARHAGGPTLGARDPPSNGQQVPHALAQVPQGQGYPPVGNFAARPAYPPQNSSSPPRAYAQPLPPMQTGYAQQAPSHLQQHHFAHNSAITNAGGHPQSAQQHNQAYAYGQHATSYQQQPQQQYQHVHAHQQWQQHHQSSNNAQAQHRPGSSQLMNGFQSPDKATIKATSSSPPQQPSASTYNAQPQQHYHQPQQIPSNNYSPHMQRSPNLAPSVRQPLQHSPVKSSPPQATPRLAQNSQTLQHVPPVANGHHAPYQNSHVRTPQTQQPHMNGAGASPHATQVAADGMTGPWPAGSNHIPQKHDQAQSPAPPPSAQSVGDRKIFPPATPLAPSPGHKSSTSSVPVKKMQLSPVMSSAPSVSTPPVLPPPAPMQPQVRSEAQPPPPIQARPGALHEQQH